MLEATTEARVELTGKCVSCFAPNSVLSWYGGEYDYLCARCAQRIDLHMLAGEHLKVYLPVALQAWREHWLARGITLLSLADVFESMSSKLYDEMQQEGIDARDAAEEAEDVSPHVSNGDNLSPPQTTEAADGSNQFEGRWYGHIDLENSATT